MSGFNIGGLSSGLDTDSIVKKMIEAEKIPLTRLESEKALASDKLPVLTEINSKLLDLKITMSDLTYETPFATKQVTTSSSSTLTGTVNDLSATNGTYIIDSITSVATATVATSAKTVGGYVDISQRLSSTIQKSLISGTFSINGVSFMVDASRDSMQKVIGDINIASASTGVIANYDNENDRLVLQNLAPGNKNSIMIGDPNNDTSNFLTAVGLNGAFQDISSGTNVVTSSGHLGALNISKSLSASKFDQAATSGKIKINGTAIDIDVSDSIVNIMNKINNSSAGVIMNYDASTDKFQFMSKNTGTSNIKFEEVAAGSNLLELVGVSKVKSTAPVSAPLDANAALSSLKLSTPYFGNSVIQITGAAGSATFNVNGAQTINDVVNDINSQIVATGVRAEYDALHGKFKLKAVDQFYTTPITATYGGGNSGNFLDSFNLNPASATSETARYGYSVLESTQDAGMVKLTDTLGVANFKNAVPANGFLHIKQGPSTYNVAYDTTMTVQDLLDAVDMASGGTIKASLNSESGRVTISPSSNGDPNLVITDSNSPGPNLVTALGMVKDNVTQVLGQNAEYKMNGNTYFSNSNTIADKITGVSFTLQALSTTPVNLTIGGDTSAAKKTIEDFVKKYNDVITQIDKELKDTEGPLYRNSTLDDTLYNLRREINKYVDTGLSSTAKSLSDIGISSGKVGMIFTKDYIGKLEIDSEKLEKSLAQTPMDVRKLFAFDQNNGNKYTDGIGTNLNKYLDSLTKLDGTYNSVIKLTDKQLSNINGDIVQWNDRIKLMEDGLRSKFQSMETLMSQLKAQSSSLTQSLNQLSSSNG